MMPARLRFTYDSEGERDPFVAEAYARGRALQIEGKAEQARNLFGVAAEQAPEDIWLRYEYALCTRMMGELDEAETQLVALQSEAEAAGNKEALVAILNGRSIIQMNRRETAAAIALLEQALPLSRDLDDRTTTAVVLINLGIQSRRQGDLDKSELQLMQALAAYDAAGISSPPGSLLNSVAMVRAEQGDLEASLDYFERAEDRFELDGENRSVAAVQMNIADIRKDLGDFEQALALLDQSLATRRELGDRRGVLSSIGAKSQLLLQLGRLDAAEAAARELLSLAEEHEDLLRQAFAHAILGEVYAVRGDGDFAVQHHRRHVSLAIEAGRETLMQSASLQLARALYLSGDQHGARETVTRVLSWARAEPSDRHEAEALAALGWLDQKAENLPQARRHYESGLALLDDPKRRSLKAKLTAERGLICLELGDLACAEESLAFSKSVAPVTRELLLLEAGLKRAEGEPAAAADLYRQARTISGEHWSDADEAKRVALDVP
jgi:tetratricopeptide (TPR) repeat protein